GVATTDHGSNSLLWDVAYYSGKIDDLRIYKDGFTELPTLENGAVYLQSAAQKNHYLKATASSVSCLSMVEPAFRGVMIEKGLADTKGVSFRMSGTDRYLIAKDGILTVGTVTDKKAATFFPETALSLPSWGEADKDAFVSYRLIDSSLYVTASGEGVTLSSPKSDAEKLSATFKITGDQTKVIEGLRGVVYYPSYALNAPQFWKWYDGEIIERDMQYAKELNFDAFRIWVSYEYWLEDPEHFAKSYNHFLSLAEQYEIKVMVSLFEGCGLADEGYDSENVWSRDYTKAWSITSPSKEVYQNSSRWNEPKAFVTWFFEHYGNDSRHMAIEIYNEPWGDREGCAKFLSEYAITVQGSVPITFGTAPAGSYNIVYSAQAGADMLHYHDNFPASADAFYQNALYRIEQGRLANLPVYCTEVQWVGGPSGINYPVYSNLAPTVETLMKTDVWAPFYWTLMVHPCYLDSYRNNYHMKNGIVQEDGSYYNVENAQAIAPEADLENAKENSHNPFDDQFYSYKYNFSDDFADKHAYKWTALGGTWSAESEAYIGAGKTLANDTAFSDFTAIFTVNPTDEAGLIFRLQDAENYYYAAIKRGTLSLYKIENGKTTTLSTAVVPYEGEAVTVTVTADGSTLSISANCTECKATDSTYTVGKIGFEANKSSVFDALSVRYTSH
ncbi:MAG: cellulase family glycosylhydrolase, partial [Clostridia bacterium]|nr:cellulase family glycosylhydrolase [Clostridia bacterium]